MAEWEWPEQPRFLNQVLGGLSDAVLKKQDLLSPDEYEEVKAHVLHSVELVRGAKGLPRGVDEIERRRRLTARPGFARRQVNRLSADHAGRA